MLYTATNRNIFLLISFSVLISLLFLEQLLFLAPILIILFFAVKNLKAVLIIVPFVALITLTSGFSGEQRTIVQVGAILPLLGYFIFYNGLDFKKYPKVPVHILFLISFILFAFIFSLVFTNYLFLGISQLIRSLTFFLIVYLYYSLLNDYNDVKYFLYALFIGAVFYFIIIFYEVVKADFNIVYLNQKLILEEGRTFIHRNAIGGFFVITISICISYITSPKTLKVSKGYIFLLFFILITGLILTNSRAAILSILFSAFYILFIGHRKVFYYLILSIIGLLPFFLIQPISDLLNLYFRFESVSTGRDFILETVFNIISKNPIIGCGPAATKYEFYNNLPYLIGSPQELFIRRMSAMIEFGQAHNFYLFLYTDLGILGFIASLLIIYIFIKTGHSVLTATKISNNILYHLVLGIQGAGIALFIRGIFEWAGIFSYGTLTTDLPFWFIFVLLIFLYQRIIIEKQNIL